MNHDCMGIVPCEIFFHPLYLLHYLMHYFKTYKTYHIKGILCEVPFFGGSALLLFYSVGTMASCNYIPQIMLNNVF